jgi:DNA helicase IV
VLGNSGATALRGEATRQMHPDLPQEQAYFDRALALRDRQQADLARAPSLSANPRAAMELRKRVRRLGLDDPDEAIAFGRIEAANTRWYIGKGAIWDDDNDLVVVNWQAPIAAPFYTATPDDPEGLDARRLFRCTGNQIREIEDVLFHEVAQAITEGRTPEPVLTDALLDALGAARAGELGDIVATIQASQYEVISRPLDELLVVQGGPGTGKTVVGLHRVSWLLFNQRSRLDARDVLVVGPSTAFVRYISSVLPSLGDAAVVQLPVQSLGPRVRIGRVDTPEVRRLKGDRRLLRLVLRGVRNRQRVEAVDVPLTIDGRTVTLDGRRVATRARQLAGRPHNEGYRMLRSFLVTEAAAALSDRARNSPAPQLQGDAVRDIDRYLSRAWPSLTPQRFLVELLSSRRQLLAAGAGTLSESELDLLALPSDAQVSTWQWSVDDVPLLDTAAALLDGVAATYDHIVVDEVQDLSPLQLESIRRRSRTGSMTVLGDLAQGTSPWAPSSWDPIVQALRHERVTTELVELEYGYRLPAEVHEVAMRLLPEIAPGMSCPHALRTSGFEVEVVAAAPDDLPAQVVAAAQDKAGDGLVGIVAPAEMQAVIGSALDDVGVAWTADLRPDAEPLVLLTAEQAKGIEFDSVVAVEPAAIMEASDQGVRALFVGLTRCTHRLTLVHARPLPAMLGLDAAAGAEPVAAANGAADGADEAPADTAGTPAGAAPASVLDLRRGPSSVEQAGPVRDPDAAAGAADTPASDARSTDAPASEAADVRPVEVTAPDGRDGVEADRPSIEPSATPPPAAADGTPSPGANGAASPPDGTVTDGDADDRVEAPGADRSAEVMAAVDALGELDHDIAAAVAAAVVRRVVRAVRPALLPLVAEEITRALAARDAAARVSTSQATEGDAD